MKLLRLRAFFLFALFSLTCNAVPSLEDYGQLPAISDVVISPNGERIAYRKTDSVKGDIIIVYSVKNSEVLSWININEIDPGRIKFANNDTILLSASKYLKKLNVYEDEFDAGTTYTFNIKSGKIEPLVDLGETLSRHKSIYSAQYINNIVGFNPNRTQVYLGAHTSNLSATGYEVKYSLIRTNINGKGRPRVIHNGDKYVEDYFMDNQDNLVAIEKYNNRTKKHSIQSHYDGKWKTIYEYTSEIRTHNFLGLSSDFKSVIYWRNDEEDLLYYKLSLADGVSSLIDDQSIDDSVVDIFVNDWNVVMGMMYGGLYPTYHLFDPKIDHRMQEIAAMLPGHTLTISDTTNNWEHIIVQAEGKDFVSDFLLFSEGQPPKLIGKSRPAILKEDVNSVATATFVARDGLKIPTILTLPLKHMANLKNLPTVMLPHGGPIEQDQVGFDYKAQALAARGYLVVQPQFRGSSGFGRKHLEAGYGEWGEKMQDDLTDAIGFLIRKGYTDPERVCIAGASYGGYAALAGSAFTPDVYQCAFSLAGISDIYRVLNDDKRRYGKNSEILPYLTRSILNKDFDKQAFKSVSPYFHIDKIKIPVMLVHGEDDTIVDFEQSKIMYKALKKAGKEVELIKLKDEDHYLREGSTRIQALKAMVDFIDKHIGDK